MNGLGRGLLVCILCGSAIVCLGCGEKKHLLEKPPASAPSIPQDPEVASRTEKPVTAGDETVAVVGKEFSTVISVIDIDQNSFYVEPIIPFTYDVQYEQGSRAIAKGQKLRCKMGSRLHVNGWKDLVLDCEGGIRLAVKGVEIPEN